MGAVGLSGGGDGYQRRRIPGCLYLLDTAAAAYDLASAKNMDAIVIGSRGATLPAIALLEATTERVWLNAPGQGSSSNAKERPSGSLTLSLRRSRFPSEGDHSPGPEHSMSHMTFGACRARARV